MAATEPRRLRKKSYRSPGPLGMAATFVLTGNGHAQAWGVKDASYRKGDDPE
jgi:hypothetical protein